MWPSALDMTRDECRGVLRRLELETYSNVVSTFRAQGGLSELKVKILDDLRNVFHISQDRHRAEARRVANDEQLCTIAETISGPNTMQEWNREGRRPFPLLPRSVPYTAFSAVANGVAETVKKDNAKLPFPSDTRRHFKSNVDENVRNTNCVVRQDPAISNSEGKQSLKRPHNIVEHMVLTSHSIKKRSITGEHVQSQSQSHMHTNTRIQQLYHNHSKTQSRHKKSTPRRNASNTRVRTSSNIQVKATQGPKNAKTGDSQVSSNLLMSRNLHTYASMPQQKVQLENVLTKDSDSQILDAETVSSSVNWPQIATSKKDITNNLSRLNMIGGSGLQGNSTEANKITTVQNINMDGRNFINTLANANPTVWPQKTQTMSTPNIRANTAGTSTKSFHKLSKLIACNSLNTSHKNNKDEGLTTKIVSEREDTELKPTNVYHSSTTTPKDNISNAENNSRKGIIYSANTTVEMKTNLNSSTAYISGNKQKIQILGQQTLPSASGVKLPVGMQFQGLQGRKNVKIFSSGSGKMFIQSDDNPKNPSQVGAVVSQKNFLGNLSISGTSSSITATTATPSSGRFQKLQLLTGANVRKPININKPDMILMQSNATPTSSIVVRSIPIIKQGKKLQLQTNGKFLNEIGCAGGSKNQNVFVIGAVTSENSSKDIQKMRENKDINTEESMITEDTPVDILPSSLTTLDNSLFIHQVSKEHEKRGVFENTSSLNNEDFITSNEVCEIKNSEHSEEKIKNVTESGNYIISTTDWEVELDQETNKTRNETEIIMKSEQHDAVINEDDLQKNAILSSNLIDNFHEVIEEETIDDDSVINENLTEGDEDMEFDVSYGSMQEDVDENESIEYMEETATSSEVLVEVYGEPVKLDSDGSIKTRRPKMLPASRTHTLIYSASPINTDANFEDGVKEAKPSNIDGINDRKVVTGVEDTANGRAQPAMLFEVDELHLSQIRNVSLGDFLSSGQKGL